MTAILGISAFYHDSAAALVVDGRIVAAAQEERFSRKKHDASFPQQAIDYCLQAGGLAKGDIDYVAFYEKPLAHFDRLLETYLAYAPRGFGAFTRAIPAWIKEKLFLRRNMNRMLARAARSPVIFLDHHESHAASAFFPSPFDEAAILTLDGVGEWSTTALGTGRGSRIELAQHHTFPHSLGLLYSAFTAWCGFEVNDGEYKLMGLAPYGEPRFRDAILQHLIDLRADGSFRLNMDYFSFPYALRSTKGKFDKLFGGPARQPEAEFEPRHCDAAASVQSVLEEAVLRMGRQLHRRTKLDKLVMAGGVALNCVANARLAREGPFEQIWIQPAAGDAGGALGAALFVWHQLLGQGRQAGPGDSQQASLLGPQFSSAEIEHTLARRYVRHERVTDRSQLCHRVAQALAEGQIVGWFQGRMEFGPRALGARSILADPRRPEMQRQLNERTKLREGFRPFAPAVLAEHATDWFELPRGQASPYMLLTADVHPSQRVERSSEVRSSGAHVLDLPSRAAEVRSTIPAVTHVDLSARVQTVAAQSSPALYELLQAFYRLTGCPVLVNTSFNVRGEPIVCTPEDAYQCFQNTGIDLLVLEDCLVAKSQVAPANAALSKGAAHALV